MEGLFTPFVCILALPLPLLFNKALFSFLLDNSPTYAYQWDHVLLRAGRERDHVLLHESGELFQKSDDLLLHKTLTCCAKVQKCGDSVLITLELKTVYLLAT